MSHEASFFPCALGKGGVGFRKREGDGKTPAETLRPLYVLYRADRILRPKSQLPIRAIGKDEGWCDDVNDRNYNRIVRLPYSASHEQLHRDDALYDIVVVLDYNIRPRIKGLGSAIFLHLARPGFLPTEGCVAVHINVMHRLLERMTPRTKFRIEP
ncbi:MAG: L,D-transpeptidase family protein [Pseudomonadota bacterium]